MTTAVSRAEAAGAAQAPLASKLLGFETPFGKPLSWAEVALASDIGNHPLNDDRCLVITSKDLGERAAGPLREFMLCVLADGASGSRFGPPANASRSRVGGAGWRASQLAQAVFVERFLSSRAFDPLDRLKDGLRAADQALVYARTEGVLSTTLTTLFLSADGTAYGASIGDSVMLVLPPRRKTVSERKLKKLGYEEDTSVGSGDSMSESIRESQLIEQWWPNKEGGGTSSRVTPGTYIVLMSDGISDSLPAATIDQLLHRYSLDRATVGLPTHTRARRAVTQKAGGGSVQDLGLDNMSAIVVRFDGGRRINRPANVPRFDDATLVCASGTYGGPNPTSGGQFGLICLAGQDNGATTAVPGFLRYFIETEHRGDVPSRFTEAWVNAQASARQARFTALYADDRGSSYVFGND